MPILLLNVLPAGGDVRGLTFVDEADSLIEAPAEPALLCDWDGDELRRPPFSLRTLLSVYVLFRGGRMVLRKRPKRLPPLGSRRRPAGGEARAAVDCVVDTDQVVLGIRGSPQRQMSVKCASIV